MKPFLPALAATIAVVLAGCRGEEKPAAPTPPATVLPPVPAEWAGRTNPLAADAATIARGRALFLQNCSPCHGPEADGKGVASAGLVPPPANFRDGERLASRGDDFLFWRISTGITNTAMPAFGATLSDDDRWAVLRFLRSLPGAEAHPTPSPERT